LHAIQAGANGIQAVRFQKGVSVRGLVQQVEGGHGFGIKIILFRRLNFLNESVSPL
jgi:hypothetical protein